MTKRSVLRRAVSLLVVVGVAAAALLVWRNFARREAGAQVIPTDAVQRREIAVTIDATGTVEPIDLVEVKSKASGQILRMPVEVGSRVKVGDLIAQIDTVDVQNQYDQAAAALRAAQAKVDISGAQNKRSDDLFAQQIITTDEHESATLDFANAQSQLVSARSTLDIARQRRDDATVRAPIAGTVLQQPVSAGQVISSATSSVSGGTSILTMADLSKVRLRALVAERDIGSVRPGAPVTVTVDAFPQRTFHGTVSKIEPQAVVQQSVTLFPVLVSISNEEGLLLPGMNGEVSMLVDRRADALAVSLDAVRTIREARSVASAVGLSPDSVSAQLDRQLKALGGGRASRGERASAQAGSGASAAPESAAAAGSSGASGASGVSGASGAPDASAASGAPGTPGALRASATSGAKADSMRARWREMRRSGASGQWGSGSGGLGAVGAAGGARAAGALSTSGTSGASGSSVASGASSASGGRSGGPQVVFVKTPNGLQPRLVRLGLSNFDYAEVLSGLEEGDEVALLSVAEMQAMRKQDQARVRERMGTGLPGASGTSGSSGAAGSRGQGTRGTGG